ncbi:P-loop containing nucleoside triphosphate hydrolase protein [Dactylonectria macrodidyma]|uniref:P-loop containing nucleoside triphosphate hydrolase protein n=1 Tax=Dactylonectria macrodidyma TaxID=307937 RepID=A0A9P9IWT9_9HYPO|nr:P-loop containing nucleoside triphosphate hydrolase protein [Dactylonectria macrodidyma]
MTFRQDSAVILIMGVTGAGKSSFISLLADQEVEVGHSLESSTVDVGIYSFNTSENKTVFLVDTPGFDDTIRPDVDILKDIVFFLTRMHEQRWRLAGVVYMHRITDPRISGTSMKNLQMFQKLCGTASIPHVTLTTTMWSALGPTPAEQQVGLRRQAELQKQFWAPMISLGAKVMPHNGSAESARAIVSAIVGQNTDTVLDIVRELVYEQKTLSETEAGRLVQQSVDEAKKKFDQEISDLQESMEEAMRENDRESQETIAKERDEAAAKIRQQTEKVEELNVSMQQLAQEKQSQFERLANKTAGKAVNYETSSSAATREKRIRELEFSLQESERSHKEALARQQLQQQSQTTAQLQNIRVMVEQSSRQRQELQRQLDYERRQRSKEQRRGNPVVAFFRDLFMVPEPEPRRSRHRERSRRSASYHHEWY